MVYGREPVVRAVGPVVGEDGAVAELVTLEEEPVGGATVIFDRDGQGIAVPVFVRERDEQTPFRLFELGGAAVHRNAFDVERAEVERQFARGVGLQLEVDSGLGAYLVRGFGDGEAYVILGCVEPREARVCVARARDRREARERGEYAQQRRAPARPPLSNRPRCAYNQTWRQNSLRVAG